MLQHEKNSLSNKKNNSKKFLICCSKKIFHFLPQQEIASDIIIFVAEVAISTKNSEVHVYKRSGYQWNHADVLQAHDMTVMCLDWAPKTNRIVTCAADKMAYVWSLGEDGKWIPAWVVLRITRAAVCVKWAPDGESQTKKPQKTICVNLLPQFAKFYFFSGSSSPNILVLNNF